MSLSLAILREDLRSHLGQDSTDLPDAQADRLLNRSWWAIASQLRFNEKDAETSFITVPGTQTYSIPPDSDAIQRVVIQGADDSGVDPLIKISDWNMFALKDDEDTERPTHYSRRDGEFILYPIPDAEYTVYVKYLRTLADIESSGPDAPQEWHEVVLWGAVSRGFFIRGDWNRGNLAQNQQALYLQSLSTQNERETVDRPYSGMKVLRRRYP